MSWYAYRHNLQYSKILLRNRVKKTAESDLEKFMKKGKKMQISFQN